MEAKQAAALWTPCLTGAIPIAVVRYPINQDELEDAGAAHVIATGDVAESMAHGGRIILYGYLDDPWTPLTIKS